MESEVQRLANDAACKGLGLISWNKGMEATTRSRRNSSIFGFRFFFFLQMSHGTFELISHLSIELLKTEFLY